MKKIISPESVAFFKFELENGDARRVKIALQDLSAFYRKGFILSSQNVIAFERAITGIILIENQDLKVVRWGLNALSEFGRLDNCKLYIDAALRKYEFIPQIQASGVAALCKMYRGKTDEISALSGIDPKIWKLAALQNTDAKNIELSNFRIDIDKSNDEILKLALVTVGLNRDIENLFHPKCGNGELVKKLCCHSNSIVQQYSVWSIIENEKLGIEHLGLNINDIESMPENVQSKVLQLIAEKEKDARRRLNAAADGSCFSSSQAREGLAKGIIGRYYDGLEEVTLKWFEQETIPHVRELLSEHFAKNSSHSSLYEEKAIDIFHSDPSMRRRLVKGSEGSKLYSILKTESLTNQTMDLFDGITQSEDLIEVIRKNNQLRKENMKILMFAISPKNEARLRVDQEYRDLLEKIRIIENPSKKLDIKFEPATRSDQIQDALLNGNPNIVHFSGHGSNNALIFEDKSGMAFEISAESFATVIGLSKDTIECVVLNCCYSDRVAQEVVKHIKYVIGCDDSIADSAAVAFSRAFYQALAAGRSIEEAFQRGKSSIELDGLPKEALKYILLKS